MKSLDSIRSQLAAGAIRFSEHAFTRLVERKISVREIRAAGLRGIVIEDYPADKYGPTSLLLGITAEGRALHFQVSRRESDMVKIITVYEPDPGEWADNFSRRKRL